MGGDFGYVFLDDLGELVLFRLTKVWKSGSVPGTATLTSDEWKMLCQLMHDAPPAHLRIERERELKPPAVHRTECHF